MEEASSGTGVESVRELCLLLGGWFGQQSRNIMHKQDAVAPGGRLFVWIIAEIATWKEVNSKLGGTFRNVIGLLLVSGCSCYLINLSCFSLPPPHLL